MAGLGAFLLVAAAATFVAVRWDQIDDRVKLAALVAVTLVCLQAHLRLRASLPITASVLLHLGVLLVPIDVAALGVHTGASWPTMLLAQGATSTVVFGLAAWAERSVVLRAATWIGVVLLAGGIGGLTEAPAGLVLAAIALATVAARRLAPSATARRSGRAGETNTPPPTAEAREPSSPIEGGAGAAVQGWVGPDVVPVEEGREAFSPVGSDNRAARRGLGGSDVVAPIAGGGGGPLTLIRPGADVWAAGWALLAGLAMPLTGAEALGRSSSGLTPGVPGAGVLTHLGLAGEGSELGAGLTG